MVIGGILLPITFLYLCHRVIHINPTMAHGVKVGLVLGEIIFFLVDYADHSVPSNCQSEMVLVFTSKVTPTLMISRPSVS